MRALVSVARSDATVCLTDDRQLEITLPEGFVSLNHRSGQMVFAARNTASDETFCIFSPGKDDRFTREMSLAEYTKRQLAILDGKYSEPEPVRMNEGLLGMAAECRDKVEGRAVIFKVRRGIRAAPANAREATRAPPTANGFAQFSTSADWRQQELRHRDAISVGNEALDLSVRLIADVRRGDEDLAAPSVPSFAPKTLRCA